MVWDGLGHYGGKERRKAEAERDVSETAPLHSRIEQMLTEARVILPGAQALLGFQLAIVITKSFGELPDVSKLMHALSLGCIALAIILLMAPAAYHRIVYAGEDSAEFHRTGSALVTAATLPLALGLGGDTYVVIGRITGSAMAGWIAGLGAVAIFVLLWHLLPLMRRHQR